MGHDGEDVGSVGSDVSGGGMEDLQEEGKFQQDDGGMVHPSTEEVLKVAGLLPLGSTRGSARVE